MEFMNQKNVKTTFFTAMNVFLFSKQPIYYFDLCYYDEMPFDILSGIICFSYNDREP